MIPGLSVDEFATTLHRHVSPTAPIQSEEHLFGRQQQLSIVTQALYAPGRSIFIYGDRGVGKTSLAQTVAFSQQSSHKDPILIACEPGSTFRSLMSDVLHRMRELQRSGSTTTTVKLGFKMATLEGSRKSERGPLPEPVSPITLNEIVSAFLGAGTARQNETIVVVIDEFDRIDSDEERTHFADFIKQIGDQNVPAKFVFCGVAESLQKLLGAHDSCFRYLEGIELKTLNYDARFEIIDNVAQAFGVVVEERQRYRIAAISDGFPHYIHRMCEKLLWEVFNDPHSCNTTTAEHYRDAVVASVQSIEQHLRHVYNKAVMKAVAGYEEVLWAVADHSDLIRSTEAIYTSYSSLAGTVTDVSTLLDRVKVVNRLNTLKGPTCGLILSSDRKGWYHFRESIMRGYVRLRAEERGCELALDYSAGSTRNRTFRLPSARKGRAGGSRAKWRSTQYPD